MNANAPSAGMTKNEERATKLSLILGIAIWFLHQNTVYALASVGCKWNWLSDRVLGVSGLQWADAAITLVALAAMAYMIYLPWRDWRRYQSQKPTDNPNVLHDTEKDRRPLLAFIAMMTNSFFFLFVLTSFVPIFALQACNQG